MKVLLVRTSAFATRRLINQAITLRKAGHDVSVLHWERNMVKNYNGKVKKEIFDDYEILTEDINFGIIPYATGISSVWYRLKYTYLVIKKVLIGNYDVVQAIDFDSALPVAIAKSVFRSCFI